MAVPIFKFYAFLLPAIFGLGACGGAMVRAPAAVYRNSALEERTKRAVVRVKLYKSKNAKKSAGCTAEVISREDNNYLLATAAHCVLIDTEEKDRSKWKLVEKIELVLTSFDNENLKQFYPAKLLAYEYDKKADVDFAILAATIPVNLPVLYLSLDEPVYKQCVLNFSFPRRKTADLLYGYVDDILVFSQKSFIIRLGGLVDPRGASGSAVIDCVDGKILGFAVGSWLPELPDKLMVLTVKNFIRFLSRHQIKLSQGSISL